MSDIEWIRTFALANKLLSKIAMTYMEFSLYYIVDTFLEVPITSKEPAAVLSGQVRTVRGTGPDGPRPGMRRRCSLVRRGRSAARGRTVRDLAQGQRFPA
jgi:hypothetical protein